MHELRHFAATALDEQGMVGKLRTEIVGHANEEITNSIYTHVRRERVAAVAAEYDPLRESERVTGRWLVDGPGKTALLQVPGGPFTVRRAIGAPRFELGTSSPPD